MSTGAGSDAAGEQSLGARLGLTEAEQINLTERIRAMALFREFSDAELYSLMTAAEMDEFEAGDVLIQAGAEGRDCFVILDGAADVAVGGLVAATLREGQVVGEMALLMDTPRSATVTAATPVRAIRLTPEAIAGNDLLLTALDRALVERAQGNQP